MLINYGYIFIVSGQYPNIRPFFLPTDKTMLAEFLAYNNKFLAIGNDFLWQITEGDTMTTFVRNLGVRFEVDGNETLNVRTLTVGDPAFFGGATFAVDYEAGEIADAYVDELSTTNGGIAVMVSQATGPDLPRVDEPSSGNLGLSTDRILTYLFVTHTGILTA